MKSLLAITTFNHCDFTEKCFESINKIKGFRDKFKVVVYDDFSTDDTLKVCRKYDVEFITTAKPMGLTYNWNRMYSRFMNNNYKNLFIVNNDILVPSGALNRMEILLKKHYFVVPLSTSKGVGHSKEQHIAKHSRTITNEFAGRTGNYQLTQDKLEKENQNDPKCHIKLFSGFFFGMNKNIKQFEFNKNQLFNPRNITVHQESDLSNRLRRKKNSITLCKQAFIFHYKGISCSGVQGRNRNDLTKYHLKYYENK